MVTTSFDTFARGFASLGYKEPVFKSNSNLWHKSSICKELSTVLWSWNYLFPLRLRLSKSFSFGNNFGTMLSQILYLKKVHFSCCLWKKIDLIHMLDPIQYEFRFFFTTLADPELGAGAETSIFRLRPKVLAPAPAKSSGSLRLRLHNTGCQYTPKRVTNTLT